MMAKDQSHEHSNKMLKSDGGPTGLIDKPESLAQNELSSIEVLRILDEFEQVINCSTASMKHPEEDKHFQEEFIEDVKKLKQEIQDKGNPFLDLGNELFTLDTHDIMPPEVIQSLKECDTIGSSSHFVN